jgi:hypothetical protein
MPASCSLCGDIFQYLVCKSSYPPFAGSWQHSYSYVLRRFPVDGYRLRTVSQSYNQPVQMVTIRWVMAALQLQKSQSICEWLLLVNREWLPLVICEWLPLLTDCKPKL